MRQETTILDALGNIGDFVGGLGVVLTLIYLATQIRQNTAALKTTSRQDVTAGFRDHNRFSLDSRNMEAMIAGIRRYPNLPSEEKWRFSTIVNDHAHFLESAFALHEAGALDDEIYETYLALFSAWVATPGGATWWSEVGPLHYSRLVAAVDERVRKGALADLLALEISTEPPAAEQAAGDGRFPAEVIR